jgi:hypothetical protein
VARWDNRCENASPTGSAENEIPMEITIWRWHMT